MFSPFFNSKIFVILFLFIIVLSLLTVPILYTSNIKISDSSSQDIASSSIISSNNFIWPIPGYSNISSYFGKRISPTAGASSYHSGIDIPATYGTDLYAIDDGIITFAGWGAGGGYTVTYNLINYPNYTISYCHVSPDLLVYKNEKIFKNQKIANVGPKNVYGIIDNPYKDSFGNPTNGSTTGSHLHLTIKNNGSAIDPLNLFIIN